MRQRLLNPRRNKISIHALREEGDHLQTWRGSTLCNFYPRPPRGGRLIAARTAVLCRSISIHALREEGDRRHTDETN